METETHSNNFKVFQELKVQEFKEKYVIRSVEVQDQGFVINRADGTFHNLIHHHGEADTETASKVYTVYGVAGTIRLLAGTYVLVITSRKEKKDEAYFQTLLRIVEETPGLYYSYETDITLNLQRRYKMADGWMSKPIWKQADPRFVWNKNILDDLIENKVRKLFI